MKFRTLVVAAGIVAWTAALAQSRPEFITLRPVSAALYMPDSGPEPQGAVRVAHRSGNSLDNVA